MGKRAPQIELELLSGEPWSLQQQRGKVVVIQFSFTGCGPCERMYPDLRAMRQEFAERLEILTIMHDEERAQSEAAVSSGKITWPIHWDGVPGRLTSGWSVRVFPTVFVIDRDGMIAAEGLRGAELRNKIAELTGR